MNIYITRHGETEWNTLWKLQGRTDICLNERGISQATRTGEGLRKTGIRFDAVYTSPLKRAVETAVLISGFPEENVKKDNRLIEIAFGKAEGTTPDDRKNIPELCWFDDFFNAPQNYKPQGEAETFESVFARTADFWENEIRSLKDQANNVLVTTHGGTLQSLLLHIDHRSLEEYWKVRFPNCSMNLITFEKNYFKLKWTSKLFY